MNVAMLKRGLSVLVLLSLTACTINPGLNQLDLLQRWAKYNTKAELEAQLWTAKIGDYEQLAIPVQHEDVMTFYLKDGTEIDFSGWDVIALRNWNYYGKSIDIDRTEIGLEHRMLDDTHVALRCTEYMEISEGFLKEGSIRSAKCEDEVKSLWSYTNGVALDDRGAAIWMLHHISPEMPPLELRLNGSVNTSSDQEGDFGEDLLTLFTK